jgi:hypothetical protein
MPRGRGFDRVAIEGGNHMSSEQTWFITDGTELRRAWVSSFVEIRKRALVKQCRKDSTCLLGCPIPTGSSYLRLGLLVSSGGCDASNIAVGFCEEHLGKIAQGNAEQWMEGLEGESFFRDLLTGKIKL